MRKNKKGFALVTTLLLSFISLGMILGVYYMINSGSSVSKIKKQYTGALESAKGAADYIMEKIFLEETFDKDGNIVLKICNNGNDCEPGDTIDLGSYNTIGNYNITATMLSAPKDAGDGSSTLYSFTITATDKDDPTKKAIIDVVYKLEQ